MTVQRFDVSSRFAAGAQFTEGRLGFGSSGRTHAVVDPANGEHVLSYELAGAADVDTAVGAARRAARLGRRDAGERSDAMHRSAAVLARASGRLRLRGVAPVRQADEALAASSTFRARSTTPPSSPGAARHLEGKAAGEYSGDHTSYVRREPIGVVGSIAPWNYPLQMAAWKILPAVAAGNTIVLKPAELTPLTSLMFAEAATARRHPGRRRQRRHRSGPGRRRAPGRHPDVAMVSFTGSTAVGKRVARSRPARSSGCTWSWAARRRSWSSTTRTSTAAVHGAVAGALINTGQDCTAATRAYVQRPLYDAFVGGVAELMAAGAARRPASTRPPTWAH